MQKEPAVIIAAIGATVSAIVTLLVAFGLDLTADQQAAILAVTATVATLIVGIVTRRFVSPVDNSPEPQPRRALIEE